MAERFKNFKRERVVEEVPDTAIRAQWMLGNWTQVQSAVHLISSYQATKSFCGHSVPLEAVLTLETDGPECRLCFHLAGMWGLSKG